MELDKRIKDRTGIQTCILFDKKYIGKKGFFFDEFCQLIDLKAKCCYGTLIDINETDVANDLCFKATSDKTGYNCFFRFFIPEDSLLPEAKPEKKYRPYSLNEFLNEHEIGDKITYRTCRFKESKEQEFIRYKAMICGYQIMEGEANTPGKGLINLGGYWVSLQVMFDDYETPNSYLYPEVWEPFGVLDKENE